MAEFGGRVVIDPAALQRFINDGNGPVVRDLVLRGERVKVRAQQLVGVKTGNLRDHIVKRVIDIGGQPAVVVGFTGVPYGLFHHEGTKPHTIEPRRAQVLAFYWPRVGRTVFARRVHHPGTKPNRFLIDALPAAAG